MLGSCPVANRVGRVNSKINVILGKSRVITDSKFPRKFFPAKYRVEKDFCNLVRGRRDIHGMSSEELLARLESRRAMCGKG